MDCSERVISWAVRSDDDDDGGGGGSSGKGVQLKGGAGNVNCEDQTWDKLVQNRSHKREAALLFFPSLCPTNDFRV